MSTVHDHQGRDSVKSCAERVWDTCEPVYLINEVHTTLRLCHHLFLNVLVEPYTLTQRRFTGESLWPEAERKKVHQQSSPRRGCSQNWDTTSFLSCTGKEGRPWCGALPCNNFDFGGCLQTRFGSSHLAILVLPAPCS
jgi:hypothetical protein